MKYFLAGLFYGFLAGGFYNDAHAATFTNTDPNCKDYPASSAVLVCAATPPPVPVAPVCSSLTATPPVLFGTGASTLSAVCSGAITGYGWAASTPPVSGFSTMTGAVQTPTIAVSTNFSVQAWNGGLGSNVVTVPVTVSGGQLACPGFSSTVTVPMNWNAPTRQFTGNISQNDAIVVTFTTGATSRPLDNLTGAEAGSPTTQRQAYLSTTPCDFSTPPALGWAAASYGSTVYLPFAIPPNDGGGYYPVLKANTPYYVNIRTVGNCPTCNMYFDLTK